MTDPDNRRVDALLGASRSPIVADVQHHQDLVALRQQWERLEAMPVLVENRLQAIDQSWAGIDIRTFLRGEESAGRFSVHSMLLKEGAGIPVHYLEDAYVYILVCAGQMAIQVGRTDDILSEGSFAFVPPRTRLAFRNIDKTPCTVMVLYSPAGAERAFDEAHAHWLTAHDESAESYQWILERYGFRFDDKSLENDARTNEPVTKVEGEIRDPGDMEALREAFFRRPAVPRIVNTPASEIDAVTKTGASFRKAVLTGDDSGGQAMVHLLAGMPGMNAPAHHQPTEEELFFIGRGGMHMICASERKFIEEGGFAFCPRNCTHGFANAHPTKHNRFVTLNSPAGHERALAAMRALDKEGATPEQVLYTANAGNFVLH